MRGRPGLLGPLFLLLLALPARSVRAQELPLFNAHIHYSR